MSLVFVFGSNLSGRHGKGAALTARREHGAVYGVAEGLRGNSYALPTCGHNFEPLPLDMIQQCVDRFIGFSSHRQDIGFQVTRVGCGLAYYKDEQIAPLFQDAIPHNVFFDKKWRRLLGDRFEYWGTF